MNESGKAKQFFDRNGNLCGIHYHEDDRPAAIDTLRKVAPAGSTIVGIDKGSGRADCYVITDGLDGRPRLHYISKYVGSALGYTIFDGQKKSGVNFGYYDLGERIGKLAELVHGDRSAYTAQEIR